MDAFDQGLYGRGLVASRWIGLEQLERRIVEMHELTVHGFASRGLLGNFSHGRGTRCRQEAGKPAKIYRLTRKPTLAWG